MFILKNYILLMIIYKEVLNMNIRMLMLIVFTVFIIMLVIASCIVYCCKKIYGREGRNTLTNSNLDGESEASSVSSKTIPSEESQERKDCAGVVGSSDDENVNSSDQDSESSPEGVDDMTYMEMEDVESKCGDQFLYNGQSDKRLQEDGVLTGNSLERWSKPFSGGIEKWDKFFSGDIEEWGKPFSDGIQRWDRPYRILNQYDSEGGVQKKRSYSTTNLLSEVEHFNSYLSPKRSVFPDSFCMGDNPRVGQYASDSFIGVGGLLDRSTFSQQYRIEVGFHGSLGKLNHSLGGNDFIVRPDKQNDFVFASADTGLLRNLSKHEDTKSTGCDMSDLAIRGINMRDTISDTSYKGLEGIISSEHSFLVGQDDTTGKPSDSCAQFSYSKKVSSTSTAVSDNNQTAISSRDLRLVIRSMISGNAGDQQLLSQMTSMNCENLFKLLSNVCLNVSLMFSNPRINMYLMFNDPMTSMSLIFSNPQVFREAIMYAGRAIVESGNRSVAMINARDKKVHANSKRLVVCDQAVRSVTGKKSDARHVKDADERSRRKEATPISRARLSLVTPAISHGQKISVASSKIGGIHDTNRVRESRKNESSVDCTVLPSVKHSIESEGRVIGQESTCLNTDKLKKKQGLSTTTYLFRDDECDISQIMVYHKAQGGMQIDPHDLLISAWNIESDRLDTLLSGIGDENLRSKVKHECMDAYSLMLNTIQRMDKQVMPVMIRDFAIQRGTTLYKRSKAGLIKECVYLLAKDMRVCDANPGDREFLICELENQVKSYMYSEYVTQVYESIQKEAITVAYKNVLIMAVSKMRLKYRAVHNMVTRYLEHGNHSQSSVFGTLMSKVINNDKWELDILKSIQKLASFFSDKMEKKAAVVVKEYLKNNMGEISDAIIISNVVKRVKKNKIYTPSERLPSYINVSCVMSDSRSSSIRSSI
ncbi:hypothetical protein FDZ63_03960 [Ehrlichia ruminantium]|nr:hypothetical protein FDZ65_03960 [Ehrlichia ruminantium]QLK53551.1 hypothetical protein FDZ64_03970 [Ehrlichia ruminantium]QLK54468.1 hypothetical protein FDZ63_03960 [Ehrlichia ruminantium]QLK57219.1 hypothetical protein FDZ60_03970 [Ehrlichia ruminantium]